MQTCCLKRPFCRPRYFKHHALVCEKLSRCFLNYWNDKKTSSRKPPNAEARRTLSTLTAKVVKMEIQLNDQSSCVSAATENERLLRCGRFRCLTFRSVFLLLLTFVQSSPGWWIIAPRHKFRVHLRKPPPVAKLKFPITIDIGRKHNAQLHMQHSVPSRSVFGCVSASSNAYCKSLLVANADK